LEYLRLSKLIADLKEMPHKETLANVMTPEYFPDELEQKKQKLLNKRGVWNT
jgi:hypothetical protein